MVFGTAKDETIVSIFRLPGGKSTGLAAVQTLAPPPAGASGKSWHGTIAASGWRCAPATHFPEPAVSEPSFAVPPTEPPDRSEEHTSELQSPCNLVCRLLLEKKKKYK